MKILTPEKVIASLEENAILPNLDFHPTLGIVIQKNAPMDELSYLKSLKRKAQEYQAEIKVCEVEGPVEAFTAINELKRDSGIFGIIKLSTFGSAEKALSSAIPPRLDIDCINYTTLGMLMGNPSPIGYRMGPCAAVAVMKLLEYEDINLAGKTVAILGRSLRVGRPLAEILSQKDATVTVFHSKSEWENLSDYDIVVSAMGKAKEISYEKYFARDEEIYNPKDLDTILIDVGINLDEKGKLCGDMDFESFMSTNVTITPVPGCVGILSTTILFAKLFSNAFDYKGQGGAQ